MSLENLSKCVDNLEHIVKIQFEINCDKCKKSKIKTADYKSVKSILENEDTNALNAIADIDLGLIPTEMIVDELLKRNGITYLRLSETEKQCMIAKGPAILIGVEELI